MILESNSIWHKRSYWIAWNAMLKLSSPLNITNRNPTSAMSKSREGIWFSTNPEKLDFISGLSWVLQKNAITQFYITITHFSVFKLQLIFYFLLDLFGAYKNAPLKLRPLWHFILVNGVKHLKIKPAEPTSSYTK